MHPVEALDISIRANGTVRYDHPRFEEPVLESVLPDASANSCAAQPPQWIESEPFSRSQSRPQRSQNLGSSTTRSTTGAGRVAVAVAVVALFVFALCTLFMRTHSRGD